MQAIFGRHWIYVGVEPDIPEPGDYFTVPMGRASIVVVRDDDMSIRAFHNVCRHRGARLCDGIKGSVGNIVCPYHQWTYDLTGKLIFNEHMGERLRPQPVQPAEGARRQCRRPALHLPRRRAAGRYRGHAPEMEPYILPHRISDCKVAFEEDLIENGNWKLTMENNRECYHCKANHPELTISLYEFGFGYQPSPENAAEVQAFKDLIKTEHARWEVVRPAVGRARIPRFTRHRLPHRAPAARQGR